MVSLWDFPYDKYDKLLEDTPGGKKNIDNYMFMFKTASKIPKFFMLIKEMI